MSGEAHLLADAVLHVLLAGGRGKSKPPYGFVLRGMYQEKVSMFNKVDERCLSVEVNRMGYEHSL